MSGPAPLWIDAVARACRSFWLMGASQHDLDARLLAELHGLGLEQGVGGRDEVRPLQQVQPCALRVCRRAAGGDDALDAAGSSASGKGEKAAAATDRFMECLPAPAVGGGWARGIQ